MSTELLMALWLMPIRMYNVSGGYPCEEARKQYRGSGRSDAFVKKTEQEEFVEKDLIS